MQGPKPLLLAWCRHVFNGGVIRPIPIGLLSCKGNWLPLAGSFRAEDVASIYLSAYLFDSVCFCKKDDLPFLGFAFLVTARSLTCSLDCNFKDYSYRKYAILSSFSPGCARPHIPCPHCCTHAGSTSAITAATFSILCFFE